MSARDRRFRSVRKLGIGLVALLGLSVVLAAVAVVLRVSEIDLLQRIRRGELVPAEEASRSDDRVAAVTITAFVVLLVTGIVWFVWQHRSQSNLHAARLRELEYTPGWAVGWWLIPFANFVKPFQTMRERWKASGGEERWRHSPTWSVIGWWWAAWILGLVLDRVASVVVGGAATLDALISGSRLFLANEMITVITAFLAIAIVRAVTERQEELRTREVDGAVLPPRPDVDDLPP
jgi:hypothetical protein